jgi:site-specific DNA-methyltransferase (cytosine-N4-specific)
LHQYKGKFNPQVVRALGNILGLEPGDTLLDPFCGSGTTLVEAAHCGWSAYGIDMNPLAVYVSQAKIGALKCSSTRLTNESNDLVAKLKKLIAGIDFNCAFGEAEKRSIGGKSPEILPNIDYLREWFPESVLWQAALIQNEASKLTSPVEKVVMTVLSDCLRDCSLQDPDDLRIRRRKDAAANYPLVEMFIAKIENDVEKIVRARRVTGAVKGTHQARRGDTRKPLPLTATELQKHPIRAVITSPPYATALPYIDTQRLSLALLGLTTKEEIRDLESTLVGSREITGSQRKQLEIDLSAGNDCLPTSVIDLCRRMLSLAESADTGFRRKNNPSLLFRYFVDMAATFRSVGNYVAKGVQWALIVGPNRCSYGDTVIDIDTPRLLGEVASKNGWNIQEVTQLDAYARFGMHVKNAIVAEHLLILRRSD